MAKRRADDGLSIAEDEKWRLIKEAGVLQHSELSDESEPEIPLAEEIVDALLYITPCSFLLLLMEILIHYQYGQTPTFEALANRMLPSVPILSVFIFYTTRYKQRPRMQFFLFVLSSIVGPRMIYLLNRASWVKNMKQCPPLITIWVYTIIQLDLGPAVLNLVLTGLFVWLKGLKLGN